MPPTTSKDIWRQICNIARQKQYHFSIKFSMKKNALRLLKRLGLGNMRRHPSIAPPEVIAKVHHVDPSPEWGYLCKAHSVAPNEVIAKVQKNKFFNK
jgi:hypothetical protein